MLVWASTQYRLGSAWKTPDNIERRHKAEALLHGIGVTVDWNGAQQSLIEAAEHGDVLATTQLCILKQHLGHRSQRHKLEGRERQAVTQVIAMARKGQPEALLIASRFNDEYLRGTSAPVFDYAADAATQGFEPAYFDLGVCYALGKQTEVDYDKAEEWLNKALSHGHADASYQLGYIHGQADWAGYDLAKAFGYFKSAADAQLPYAFSALGYCLWYGMGTEASIPMAVDAYEQGVALGDPMSMAALAGCYENGVGVSKDLTKAQQLSEQARAAGFEVDTEGK